MLLVWSIAIQCIVSCATGVCNCDNGVVWAVSGWGAGEIALVYPMVNIVCSSFNFHHYINIVLLCWMWIHSIDQ